MLLLPVFFTDLDLFVDPDFKKCPSPKNLYTTKRLESVISAVPLWTKRQDPHISLQRAADTRLTAGWEVGARFDLCTFRELPASQLVGREARQHKKCQGGEHAGSPLQKKRGVLGLPLAFEGLGCWQLPRRGSHHQQSSKEMCRVTQ